MAKDIARASLFVLTPTLLPFGEEGALFYCSSSMEASKLANLGHTHTQGAVLTLIK